MKRLLYNIELIILCTAIWIVLNESITVYNIFLGILLGILSIYITNHYLLYSDYKEIYYMRLFWIIKYLAVLICQIYISGFSTIPKIIIGNINPNVVEVETVLENDLFVCLLANSITLTPGTVTVDKLGRSLKVLWIDCSTEDTKGAGKIIKGKFEKILLEG